MALVNEYFLRLHGSSLFADVARKVNAFKLAHPRTRVISLATNDVTRPLAPAVIEAMHKAVSEMAEKATFRGYGPVQGYDFLRDAIVRNDYLPRGIHLDASEIFVSDGVRSDMGNIQELLRWDNSIGVTDPIYPLYTESNAMIGRTGVFEDGRWRAVTYFPCTADNDFTPQLPDHRVDMIYLCYPNNPTGTVLRKEQLRRWVNYANRNDSVILFDAACEAYIHDDDIPHSIYEIKGARKCAIEFRSYSKTAGFTGVRCGYTVIPHDLTVSALNGRDDVHLNPLWERRQATKFNGASYISQRAAEAVYTPEGKAQIRETTDYYMQNARLMLDALRALGLQVWGGENAPYLWVRTPNDTPSWKFFDELLYGCGVVCTPGAGFGPGGEGYVRLTAFGDREDVEEAMNRMAGKLKQ